MIYLVCKLDMMQTIPFFLFIIGAILYLIIGIIVSNFFAKKLTPKDGSKPWKDFEFRVTVALVWWVALFISYPLFLLILWIIDRNVEISMRKRMTD